MNKSPAEARAFIGELNRAIKGNEATSLVLLVPALCLETAAAATKESHIRVGGQNCHFQAAGAFTGENSPQVMAQMGAQYCLVGHSERRQFFGETDEIVARKIRAVQNQGMTPIMCVGEDLKQREAGDTEEVLRRQLQVGLNDADEDHDLWIAYEPVWAIGTGKVATVDQVRGAHAFIREWLERCLPKHGDAILLYGGSVKPDNAGELADLPNVNGFLIGGASLEISSYLGILRSRP
jgi:triosephosphate isomerase (TIM)